MAGEDREMVAVVEKKIAAAVTRPQIGDRTTWA